MVISPSSLDTNLSQLLQEVAVGKMQLPEFQRSWTWDDNRIRGIQAFHKGILWVQLCDFNMVILIFVLNIVS